MELLVVCVLIGVMLTLALPNLRQALPGDDVTSVARRIIGTVRTLRDLAIREHQAYLLHFDLEEGRLWYIPDNEVVLDEESKKTALQLPDTVRLAGVEFASREVESRREMVLWISEQGYMDKTVIRLQGRGEGDVSIVFSPFSGSASVHDEYVEVR